MCDEWMQGLRLSLTPEEFRSLPRHPAFRYEFLSGQAYITPRPRTYHALLDLASFRADPMDDVERKPVSPDDWEELETLFAAAFARTQPFAALDGDTRRRAAAQVLKRARDGGDGPWIESASFVAWEDGERIGAILVTLLPAGDPCDWGAYHWPEEPPADAVTRRLGRPHLTWVFVSPHAANTGVATALLDASASALLRMGYTELLTTFMIGNDASLLWHWRCGFRLLPHPLSPRRAR